ARFAHSRSQLRPVSLVPRSRHASGADDDAHDTGDLPASRWTLSSLDSLLEFETPGLLCAPYLSRRPDVLVYPEQVLRIIMALDIGEPPIVRAIHLLDARGFVAGHEVHIGATR